MAIYLQIETDLIPYELGDELTSPSKVLFLVSDAPLSESERWFILEYAYEYDQPVGDAEDIQLPFVAEIENKFYYSLPWRTIQLIDSTIPGKGGETPTPSPSPSATITPTFFEEEPIGEYIYDSMDAVSIIGGDDGASSVGWNDRSLTTIQGVAGVDGLSINNNIVTLTESGRYYIKARTGAYRSDFMHTRISFLSGDYLNVNFVGPKRWAKNSELNQAVSESVAIVDITQTTTFKIQTSVQVAHGTGLTTAGESTLFVQKLASADGSSSSSNGSSSSGGSSTTPDAILSFNVFPIADQTDISEITIKCKNDYLKSVDPVNNDNITNITKFDVVDTTEASSLTSTTISNTNLFFVINDTLYYVTDANTDSVGDLCDIGIYTDYNPSTPQVINFLVADIETAFTGNQNTPVLLEHINGYKSFVRNGATLSEGGSSSSGGASIVTGNYTGNGETSQTIDLGFRPAVVHVQCLSGPFYGTQTQIDGMDDTNVYQYKHETATTVLTGTDDAIEITDTGFKVSVPGNNSGMNHDTSKYYYYAISESSSSSGGSSLSDGSSSGGIVLEATKTDSTTIVHGTEGILKCNAISSDLHSAYDASTGIFTTPYDMDVIMIGSVAVDTYTSSSLYIKLVNLTQNKIFASSADVDYGQVAYRTVNAAGAHKVNAGDQLTMKVQVYSSNAGMQFVPKNVNLSIVELNNVSSSSGSSSSGISAWGVFDGTSNYDADNYLPIKASENIESIKYISTGIYEVTLTTPMPNEHYSVSVNCNPSGYGGAFGGVMDLYNNGSVDVPTASKFRIDVRTATNAQTNSNRITFHVVGGDSGTSAFEVSTDTTDSNPIEIEASSVASDAETVVDNLTFQNPPNNIILNDVVFHLISHSSDYIKYQGLNEYNDTYTIFFNDDADGTLKMTSDDDNSIFMELLSLINYK